MSGLLRSTFYAFLIRLAFSGAEEQGWEAIVAVTFA
jgi:hypothetical protein